MVNTNYLALKSTICRKGSGKKIICALGRGEKELVCNKQKVLLQVQKVDSWRNCCLRFSRHFARSGYLLEVW